MASKGSTALDLINELLKPCPEVEVDSDLDFDTQAKVADYDFEDGIDVDPRKSNLTQVSTFADDPRYTGVKVTRKNVDKIGPRSTSTLGKRDSNTLSLDALDDASDSDAEDGEDVGEDEDDNEEGEEGVSEDDNEDASIGNEFSDESISDNLRQQHTDGSIDEGRPRSVSEKSPNSIQHISNTSNLQSEFEKANAVKNQLYFWDKILECRIRFQKSLSLSNRFPKHTKFSDFKLKGGSSFSFEAEKVQNNCKTLLDKLISLQGILIDSYLETKDISGLKSDECMNECISQSRDKIVHTENYENVLSSQHNKYLEFRNATIQKWNDRTKVSSGRTKQRDFSSFEQTTLQQIQHILSNRPRLIQRTRLRGSVGPVLGESAEEESEHDPEIFDDSDFYHQMLKEIIERHSDGSNDSTAVGRRWAAIQKLRSKMKRHVDTRATKGRRLRFTPYPKLVGLMAPINLPTDWDDRTAGELFNSLFGQKKR